MFVSAGPVDSILPVIVNEDRMKVVGWLTMHSIHNDTVFGHCEGLIHVERFVDLRFISAAPYLYTLEWFIIRTKRFRHVL
jgi:hypothetical protein